MFVHVFKGLHDKISVFIVRSGEELDFRLDTLK